MTEIKDSMGNVIHRSKNLRGIMEYTRAMPVEFVNIIKTQDGADVFIRWICGAVCHTKFASYTVACEFFNNPRRRFKPCVHMM